MGVVAEREITAVHVHPAQRVAVAVDRVEAVAQHRRALDRLKRQPGHGGGFGEGAAEAFQGLKAPRAVDHHAGQVRVIPRGRQRR